MVLAWDLASGVLVSEALGSYTVETALVAVESLALGSLELEVLGTEVLDTEALGTGALGSGALDMAGSGMVVLDTEASEDMVAATSPATDLRPVVTRVDTRAALQATTRDPRVSPVVPPTET
ncbi:hypothetical protein V5799_026934 [Amblyomma americanum]|uniref:Uncharacterized protein n=1 Tax=Amblyomma americanum TaxID=6943 RepID=A0AAQ4DH53_AMBAM